MRLVTFNGKPVRRQEAVEVVTFKGTHRAIKSMRSVDEENVEVEFWRQSGQPEHAVIPKKVVSAAKKMIRVKYYGSQHAELISPDRWRDEKDDVISTESRQAVVEQLTTPSL